MVFQDPILAGATLVRDGIQSEGYVAGSVGWRINRDGSAEFNSGTFRGDVVVNNPSGTGYVRIRINQATGVPQIELNPETVSGVTVSSGGILTQPPSGAPNYGNTGPSMIVSGPYQDALNAASIEIRGQGKVENSRITLAANDVASAPILSRNPDGTIETWHPLVFANGWSNLGGGYVTMQYRRVATPPNSVQLVGVMNVGTKTSGAVVGNLPVGYRPISKVRVPVSSNGSNSGGQTPAFDILPSGDITVASGSGFPAGATDCEVCAVVPLDA